MPKGSSKSPSARQGSMKRKKMGGYVKPGVGPGYGSDYPYAKNINMSDFDGKYKQVDVMGMEGNCTSRDKYQYGGSKYKSK